MCACVYHLFKHCHSVPAVDHPGTEVRCRRRFVVFTRLLHKLTDRQYFRHVEFERAEHFREVPMGSDGFGHSGSDWARRVSLTTPEEPVRCWAEPSRQDRAFTHTGSLSKLRDGVKKSLKAWAGPTLEHVTGTFLCNLK